MLKTDFDRPDIDPNFPAKKTTGNCNVEKLGEASFCLSHHLHNNDR